MSLVDEVARTVWEVSRADEGAISATGAKKVAQAVVERFLPVTAGSKRILKAEGLAQLMAGDYVIHPVIGGFVVARGWQRKFERDLVVEALEGAMVDAPPWVAEWLEARVSAIMESDGSQSE